VVHDPAIDLDVRVVADGERSAAGAVAGRALCDDPLVVFLHGDDVAMRLRASYDMFVGTVVAMPDPAIGGFLGNHAVAVVAASAPGTCFMHRLDAEYRMMPDGPLGAPGSPDRLRRAMANWCANHTDERHWHVGPVAVEPILQGKGLGSLLMRAFCDRMDEEGELAWLETERPENVVFYRRLGFEVAGESDVHSLHTWFMRRAPR
jgi:GNAT superfamily N-acetyltransferase